MIALLLAAQLVAAPPAAPFAKQVPGPPGRVFTARRYSAARCAGSARYQTSGPEPALLLRPQDERARGAIKRLIDMPMGEFCLTGAAASGGGR